MTGPTVSSASSASTGPADASRRPARRPGIALALSGGGYRATLFHLGGLWRLNELGLLPKLARVSSVSGGSITAAYLGLKWRRLSFDANGVATDFAPLVVDPLRAFCSKTIDVPAFLAGHLAPWMRPSDMLAWYYRGLFGEATLRDLPDDKAGEGPRFVINTMSLQTGVNVRFSRPYVADWTIGMYEQPDIPLTRAVAASSGFPPIFSPVVIKPEGGTWDAKSAERNTKPEFMREFVLCDGGAYDNLGLETIDAFETILVSDAGGPLKADHELKWGRVSQLLAGMRTVEAMLSQVQALRKRQLFDLKKEVNPPDIAYWEMSPRLYDGVMPRGAALTGDILRTRLNRFTAEEQGRLINWGYAMADMRMSAHIPGANRDPRAWPVPEHALDRA